MHVVYWSCSSPKGTYITDDYDIHGYAFPWPFLPCPLCGQSFMHTIMYLHLSECVLVMVRGMIMTSRDMCFPHNHVLYEDS